MRPLREELEYCHGAAIALVNTTDLWTVPLHQNSPLPLPRQPPESPPLDHKSASSSTLGMVTSAAFVLVVSYISAPTARNPIQQLPADTPGHHRENIRASTMGSPQNCDQQHHLYQSPRTIN